MVLTTQRNGMLHSQRCATAWRNGTPEGQTPKGHLKPLTWGTNVAAALEEKS